MKIAIVGYSGAGKSTLARYLGSHYDCPVLHLDRIHFASGWIERPDEDMLADALSFMEQESWIIDGNYSNILYQRRLEEADQIIILDFGRMNCLQRAYKRYRLYRGQVRSDMAEGCPEKFDWEFVRWILWDGRSGKARARYKSILADYPDKTILLKNQAELERFYKQNAEDR